MILVRLGKIGKVHVWRSFVLDMVSSKGQVPLI